MAYKREWGLFNLEKRLIAVCKNLKGFCGQVGVDFILRVARDRKSGNGLKLHRGKFKWDLRKNSLSGRVVKHWNRLPGEWWSHHTCRCSRMV